MLVHASSPRMSEAVENPAARDITADASRDYQPTGRPEAPQKRRKPPDQ